MTVPTLSVNLVTRNRADGLRRTLESLRGQRAQPFEVIVSDDSGDAHAPETRAVAEAFGARYTAGPRRGLYANRNHVAPLSRGSHIRTMDDDHEFPPGHLEACLAAIEDDPGAIWVMNETIPGRSDPGQPHRTPPQLTPRGYSDTPPPGTAIWSISDGAAIYPRAVFDSGERFSEAFVMGAAYLEFGSRLLALGHRIRHLDATYIVHHEAARQARADAYDVQSRHFAAVMHSFVYQPSWRNRAWTVGEMGLAAVRDPRGTPRRVRVVGAAVRERLRDPAIRP